MSVLSTSDKIALLFKKYLQLPNTNTDTKPQVEYPLTATNIVHGTYVGIDTIPTTVPTDLSSSTNIIDGYRQYSTAYPHIKKYTNLALSPVSTNPTKVFIYNGAINENLLTKAISPNMAAGSTLYDIIVQENIGTALAPNWVTVDSANYIYDRDAGIITFYNSINLSANNPRITFWRYEGQMLPYLVSQVSTNTTNIATNTSSINTITTTTIPNLQNQINSNTTNISANTTSINNLNNTTIPILQSQTSTNTTNISAINSYAIPGLQSQITTNANNISTNTSSINTINNTTIPNLQSQITSNTNNISTNTSSINTINTTYIPSLQSQITSNTNSISSNTSSIDTLNNTTIPNLQSQTNTNTTNISSISTRVASAAVKIGTNAGSTIQGSAAVAIGYNAGMTQATGAIAIGDSAAMNASTQGTNSIAIGRNAGKTTTTAGSIIVNASGNDLSSSLAGLYVDPVRNNNSVNTNYVSYNTSTKEVSYNNSSLVLPNIYGTSTITAGTSNAQTSARIYCYLNENTTPGSQFVCYSEGSSGGFAFGNMVTFETPKLSGNSTRDNANFQFGMRQVPSNNDYFYVGRGGVSGTEWVIDKEGRMAIGSDTPTYQLQLFNAPNYRISTALRDAAKPSGSNWIVTSDQRVKDNIEDADLDILYNNVKSIKLRRFTYNQKYVPTNDKTQIGFIAQEVKQVYPKAVHVIPENKFVFSVDDKGMPVDYEIINDFHNLDSDQLWKCAFGALKKTIQKVEVLESYHVPRNLRLIGHNSISSGPIVGYSTTNENNVNNLIGYVSYISDADSYLEIIQSGIYTITVSAAVQSASPSDFWLDINDSTADLSVIPAQNILAATTSYGNKVSLSWSGRLIVGDKVRVKTSAESINIGSNIASLNVVM